MSFPKMRLDKVCRITMGQAPSGDSYNFDGNGLALIAGAGDLGKETPEPKKYTTAAGKRSEEGEIILCIRATIGDLNWSDKEYCLGRGVAGLFGHKAKLDQKYLWHWLKNVALLLKSKGKGATFLQVTKEAICSLEIPLPPLSEQRRIASILDQADELRQKRQQAIEKLDQLLQATFIDMFGDPVSNPKGWDKKLLSGLVTIDAPLVEPMEKEFENLLHYGPDRISKDSGKLLPALTAKEDMLISKKFLCDDRHILYSKIRPYLNKVAMVQEKCLCSADVYPVEPKSQLTKHFLWHILRSKSFLDHAETFSNRANIPKINRNQFLQYECIVPTMEVQQKFENISKDIQRQIDFQNLSLESIEKLFNSLQQKAFSETL
ncbi:restriction endonuclease subunit S [Acinetobacter sp. ETR1]|uniref:restriction endonuclease subunit S n=1 Tax=unclassified Acinetobacter TaxID=196816 RepID=UPI000B305ED8|nr:restriction endonuclease subunit S [Acinetobacter sp. ETR1]